MTSGDLHRSATGFDKTSAFASGGNDTAFLYDSEHDDLLVSRFNHSYLTTGSVENHVHNFEMMQAFAGRGGVDEAQFYDTTGSDRFIAKPTYAYIFNRAGSFDYLNYQSGFKKVGAFSTNGGTDLLDQYGGLDYFFTRNDEWDVRGF